ncbi:40S ribosomal protein S4 [Termitomyces sp. T112]|nr:40S ribosomal protein S4 [Termitomyces sp. T112]
MVLVGPTYLYVWLSLYLRFTDTPYVTFMALSTLIANLLDTARPFFSYPLLMVSLDIIHTIPILLIVNDFSTFNNPILSMTPARGPKKHLKRLAAPSSWMLDKLSGTYAPRPSPGPHKLRESLPLTIFLRNRLKYALTGREVTSIVKQRLIKIDGKVRTDETYPAGFMDVISIEKSGEHFRLLYDVKGRFTIHRITPEEASYKLLKVRRVAIGARGVPHIVTHDGRTIRYPDPLIQVNDTVKFDLEQGKIVDYVKFDTGNIVMITGGRNMGRAGVIVHREKHIGGFDIVHVKDSLERTFATRVTNIFVIGEGTKPWISLPKGKGTKLTISEERDVRRKQKASE